MDNPNNEAQHDHNHDNAQKCGFCGPWAGHHRHYLLRWLLGLIILAVVFCVGVKVGRFSSEFGGYGHEGYGHHGNMMQRSYFNEPMMYGNDMMIPPAANPQTGTSTAPAPQPLK